MAHILIIEDDNDERELFKIALERAGYEVMDAPNGRVGLDLYYKQPCPIVITDIFMPEKEGLETIFALRREFFGVRIIAISGGSTMGHHGGAFQADEVLSIAKAAGADRILAKPIDLKDLVNAVAELL
jgi:CheY-like chemotaxis protein